MRVFSMFSGIGGFEKGIEDAENRQQTCNQNKRDIIISQQNRQPSGWYGTKNSSCIGYSESDRYASAIYRYHYPDVKNYGDCRTIDPVRLPDFDLITAGFPCQSFSIAGKRGGFEDTRGTLFFEIARIARVRQPMFLLLENVKGLLSSDGGRTFETILTTLQELGYYTNYEVYNSKEHGVPQNRERVIFKCTHLKGLVDDGQWAITSISKAIMKEYLFQALLNHLGEVKKLPGVILKDWVIGWLLLKEISLTINPEVNGTILDSIMIPMEGSMFQCQGEEVWQSIDTLLNNYWEENYLSKNKYTTSTAIKATTNWRTFTFQQMLLAIFTCIAHWRNSLDPSWNQMLSDLILIEEDTNYARVNNRDEKIIVTENRTLHFTDNLQDFSKNFVVKHLRETSRPKVFPIREVNQFPALW